LEFITDNDYRIPLIQGKLYGGSVLIIVEILMEMKDQNCMDFSKCAENEGFIRF